MNFEAGAISSLSIVCTIISIIICIGVPLFLVLLFYKKMGSSIRSIITGAITFFVFALVLEQIMHVIFILINWPVSRFINTNPFAYAIYASFAAGIFEETGRFIAMSTVLKKQNKRGIALGYGIGHGGLEAILIGGISAISSLILMLAVNQKGMTGYLETLPDKTAAAMSTTVLSLYTTSSYLFLIAGAERLIAITLQIGLSILVFTAVKNKKYRYLFFIALAIHIAVDFSAGLYQKRIITNIYLVEGWSLLVAIVTGLIGFMLYKNVLTKNDEIVDSKDIEI